jgi:hypothetical protein
LSVTKKKKVLYYALLAVLDQCYGQPDSESVEAVKKIYKELNLKRNATAHMNETRDDIHKQVSIS